MKLRIMADYDCYPLWQFGSGSSRNVCPSELPIPDELIRRLSSWQRRYDDTLLRTDPVLSGFSSVEEELSFEREGRDIWREMRSALGPGYQVSYFSDVEGKCLDESELDGER